MASALQSALAVGLEVVLQGIEIHTLDGLASAIRNRGDEIADYITSSSCRRAALVAAQERERAAQAAAAASSAATAAVQAATLAGSAAEMDVLALGCSSPLPALRAIRKRWRSRALTSATAPC